MGPAINLRRIKAILKAANAETASTPSTNLVNTVQDRLLWTSGITMTAIATAKEYNINFRKTPNAISIKLHLLMIRFTPHNPERPVHLLNQN